MKSESEPHSRFASYVSRLKMTSTYRIIVTGLIAQHPWMGGVTWDYLQYAVGLNRLGHDVYYFEDSGEWPYTVDGGPSGNEWIARDCSHNVEYLAKVMSRFGLADKWAYHFPIDSQWFGLPDSERRAVIESADLLINVSGTLVRPQEYRRVRRLVYVDSDPAFTQIKTQLDRGQDGFRARVDAHDVFFSFGEHFSSAVPETGHNWRPTRQPILLSEWHSSTPARAVYTTVMNWTSYKPLCYAGHFYGQKDVEFKRYLELPEKVYPIELEVALSKLQHTDWQTDIDRLPDRARQKILQEAPSTPADLLACLGWRVVNATEVCSDLDRYRRYIESSKAEWSVAKNGYVVTQPGWFSCRSACYLAAGRPVVVQDTGFSAALPVGEGILSFKTVEEAIAQIHNVQENYERRSKAARAIAEEYFDSDKVLSRLVDQAWSGDVGDIHQPRHASGHSR
ncbi:MAG: glycosyltransferase [Deltaproteobacteria bacterium]|nr:glycosyltransferase [Deltaproteobacteria bacterium]